LAVHCRENRFSITNNCTDCVRNVVVLLLLQENSKNMLIRYCMWCRHPRQWNVHIHQLRLLSWLMLNLLLIFLMIETWIDRGLFLGFMRRLGRIRASSPWCDENGCRYICSTCRTAPSIRYCQFVPSKRILFLTLQQSFFVVHNQYKILM
jgi:hypothetical protein